MTTPAPQLTMPASPRELFRKEALLDRDRGDVPFGASSAYPLDP